MSEIIDILVTVGFGGESWMKMFNGENEEVTLDTIFLAMRPGEQLHFSKIPYDHKPCFIVMLLETPPFPGDSHKESKSLSVICATQHSIAGEDETERYGWVHLEQNIKEVIGAGLERFDAEPSQVNGIAC